MQIQDLLLLKKKTIEQRLKELIPLFDSPQVTLFEAASYALLLPGKRLRPLFVLCIAEDLGIPIEHAIDPASAIELIHTYSMIHDDLPCMDDDDLRRGMPTLHKVYGEGQAVLAGDYLLTYAFEILANAPHLEASQKLDLIDILSKRSGGKGMIGGQVVDLLYEGKEINQESLDFMYAHKTAALFAAALEFGAVIGNLPLQDRHHLKNCGVSFGIGYQMTDDILDISSDEKTLGKPIGSDEKNQKATCLSLYQREKAEERSKNFLTRAIDELSFLSRPLPFLQALLQKCQLRLK